MSCERAKAPIRSTFMPHGPGGVVLGGRAACGQWWTRVAEPLTRARVPPTGTYATVSR
jgi:hypothetical protein